MITKKAAIWIAVLTALLVGAFGVVASSVLIDHAWVRGQNKVLVDSSEYQMMQRYQSLFDVDQKIKENYFGKVNEQDKLVGAKKGLVNSLKDPYSEYFTAKEYQEYSAASNGEYVGIGVSVEVDPKDNMFFVFEVKKSSPAEEAGLLRGDKFMRIAQGDGAWVDVSNASIEEIQKLVLGDANTFVRLTMLRDKQTYEVKIMRRKLKADMVTSRVINGIGVLSILSFTGNAADLLPIEIEKMKKQNIKGLVIDLRNNGGGDLGILNNVSERLLPKGVLLEMRNNHGGKTVIKLDNNYWDIKKVAIVNGETASAAEVFAAAARELGGYKIVGTKTFGKGIAQAVINLEDGSVLKLTTDSWFTQSGKGIHKIGVKPDVVIDLPQDVKDDPTFFNDDTDTQLQKALSFFQ